MKKIPELKTERLVLRPFNLSDVPEVQKLAGDRAIADTTTNIPYPYEYGMAEDWISTHQETFEQDQGVTFAITSIADGDLMGAIGLMSMTKNHQAELGYWIGKPFWNNGYCTEAGKRVLSLAFSELNLIRIHASFFSRNLASGKVMEKLGMSYEGCRPKHIRKWDKFEDLMLYGILKEDWEEL